MLEGAEAGTEPPGGGDQPGGEIHQLLDDGPEPPALGWVAQGGDLAGQPDETDEAQDVVGEYGKAQQ